MRRYFFALATAFMLLLVIGSPASANSVTVQGTGDIDRMRVDNAQNAMTVKLYGLKRPCSARYFKIVVFWGDKAAYQADAGCYPGGQWITSLYFQSDRNSGDPDDAKEVNCPKFRLAYNSTGKFYRAFIPRACMPRAPDRVRVRSEGINYSSTTGSGEAGPTGRLRRG